MSRIGEVYVPAEGDPTSNLYLVGEAPGYDETLINERTKTRRPFIGSAGNMLRNVLKRNGICADSDDIHQCYITNLCGYRPADNDFDILRKTPQLEEGLEKLRMAISSNRPNCVVALGNEPLEFLCGRRGITNYRGSILPCTLVEGIKVVAAFHPSHILQSRRDYPLFDFDINRAINESAFPELNYPKLDITIAPTQEQLQELVNWKGHIACDIETVKGTLEILCIAFSHRDYVGICLPFTSEYYPFIVEILANDAPKIFHNGVFDVSVLNVNGISVNNYTDDTIIAAHTLQPELPKDLGTLTTWYTRIPYYKSEGRASIPSDSKGWSRKRDKKGLYQYCATDTITTRAAWCGQILELDREELIGIYRYAMELQQVAIELGHTGLSIDEERRSILAGIVEKKLKYYMTIFWNLCDEKEINPDSPKQICELLYDSLKLPVKYNKKSKGKKKSRTADEDAIVALIGHCEGKLLEYKTDNRRNEWKVRLGILRTLLQLRGWGKLRSAYINIKTHDGKIKSTWKVPGAETARWSAGLWMDKSGCALQTVPRESIEA